jgi:hypothetical protein
MFTFSGSPGYIYIRHLISICVSCCVCSRRRYIAEKHAISTLTKAEAQKQKVSPHSHVYAWFNADNAPQHHENYISQLKILDVFLSCLKKGINKSLSTWKHGEIRYCHGKLHCLLRAVPSTCACARLSPSPSPSSMISTHHTSNLICSQLGGVQGHVGGG